MTSSSSNVIGKILLASPDRFALKWSSSSFTFSSKSCNPGNMHLLLQELSAQPNNRINAYLEAIGRCDDLCGCNKVAVGSVLLTD